MGIKSRITSIDNILVARAHDEIVRLRKEKQDLKLELLKQENINTSMRSEISRLRHRIRSGFALNTAELNRLEKEVALFNASVEW